jgi:lipopolysaccharide transport system ATP-binding protein
MTDAVIRVENLGKKYVIGHQKQERYLTLRDAIAQTTQSLGRSLLPTRHKEKPSNQEEFWALKDVSFEIKQGDRVGIIGRNGAGKSTLLKILSRITEPTTGRISIKGRVASLLEVGTGFHPELTGRENIYLNGAILGMGKAEISRKFDEIVTFAEVERFLDTPVKRYSSGMYVRLAFAVAAHLESETLIVDEVLAVGDSAFQKKCLGKMENVSKGEGRTVLFVSHNMRFIESLCSRGIVLNEGCLTIDDSIRSSISMYYDKLQNKEEEPLYLRSDREGNSQIKFVDIKISDQYGIPTRCIYMGESFSVILTTKGEVKNAVIGIQFGNFFQRNILRGYTYEQFSEAINLNGESIITCNFIDFPLMHGVYDIHITIGSYPPYQACDRIEKATGLEILPADVFNTGHTLDPKGGIAFCKSIWKVEKLRNNN